MSDISNNKYPPEPSGRAGDPKLSPVQPIPVDIRVCYTDKKPAQMGLGRSDLMNCSSGGKDGSYRWDIEVFVWD